MNNPAMSENISQEYYIMAILLEMTIYSRLFLYDILYKLKNQILLCS